VTITVHTVSVTALEGKRLETGLILAANVANEVGDDLHLGWPSCRLGKTGSVEDLTWPVHVVFDQPLFIPPEVSKEDGRLRFGDVQNHVDLVDELVLLLLYIGRLENPETNIVRCLLLVPDFLLRVDIYVGFIVEAEVYKATIVSILQRNKSPSWSPEEQTFIAGDVIIAVILVHVVFTRDVGHEVVIGIHIAVGCRSHRSGRCDLGAG
jgi:hypothetical protein